MAKRRKADPSEKLSQLVVKGMQEKKATNIVVLDLRKVRNAVADFFVIGTGNSDKQLDAIADSINDEVFKGLKETAWHKEGKKNKEWMLLDYSSVVAHVFRRDLRSFYALENVGYHTTIVE